MKYEVEVTARLGLFGFTVEVEVENAEEALKRVKEGMEDNWYGRELMLAAESADVEVEDIHLYSE